MAGIQGLPKAAIRKGHKALEASELFAKALGVAPHGRRPHGMHHGVDVVQPLPTRRGSQAFKSLLVVVAVAPFVERPARVHQIEGSCRLRTEAGETPPVAEHRLQGF